MDLEIPYKKCLSKEEAFVKVKENITEETIGKFKVKAQMDYNQEEGRLYASGTGFDLYAEFGKTSVELTLKLSMLLRPMKSKVLEVLKKEFQKVL